MPPEPHKETADPSFEVLQPSVLESMQRAEIDTQIATAKRYPRSLEQFKRNGIAMATLDEETAASCLYRRPVGMKDGRPEFAEGMSVRCAEIVGACYGNLRVYTTTLEQTERFCRVRGMAIDLESNFASSSEVTESTVTKLGAPFSERMRLVVLKAAHAKARRDATFQVVPKALAKPIEVAVRKLLVGDAQSMEKRRSSVVGWIKALGIEAKRVYAAIGVAGPADMTEEHLETLTGLRTAIKDNEVTIDEAFPVEAKKPDVGFFAGKPSSSSSVVESSSSSSTPPLKVVEKETNHDDGDLGPEKKASSSSAAESSSSSSAATSEQEQLPEDADYKVVNATLRGLIKSNGLSEDQVLAFLKSEGVAKKTNSDLWELSNAKLLRLCNTWNASIEKIKAMEG